MKSMMGHSVDMDKLDLIAFLTNCDHRERTDTHHGFAWTRIVVEVKHQGRWLRVCRTDLKDDVATLRVHATFLHWLAAANNSFGARIREGSLRIIDRLSDG